MPHSLKHYAPTFNRDPTHRLGFGKHHNTLAVGAPMVMPAYEVMGHVDFMAPAHVDYLAPAHVDYIEPVHADYIAPAHADYMEPVHADYIAPELAPGHVDYLAPAHMDTFAIQPNLAPTHMDVIAAPMYVAPVAMAPMSGGRHSMKHYAPTMRRDSMHKLGFGKHHANLNPAMAGMYY